MSDNPAFAEELVWLTDSLSQLELIRDSEYANALDALFVVSLDSAIDEIIERMKVVLLQNHLEEP